ncbi:MAG TPA: Stk1 family PASTA domain-containing Ser/Thr kinase [Acidimicrobiia bacterium]|nr:Stk1 family PASTA domain-containing Ser/Thr kinase [Acidimicrobiia bacterium]
MDTPSVLNERYEITSHIARGGMADVYEGRDTELNRTVAIKVLHSQFSADEAFVKRFRREAQAAANLSHPNIVGIFDWGQSEGTYFIIMEIIEGRSLRDVLKSEGALLPRRATEIAAETAAALSVAHQAGLVHRDVKPGNVLLAKDGTVKVTDFGIARAWDDSQELTRTGAVIGTATYFSPEQAQGASADVRSDVYSLGVVLYEMLTGRPPFTGDSPMSVAFQHVSTEAPAPNSLNPDVPDSLNSVVMKAMRKDPNARYQSAEEIRQDLLSVLQGENVMIAPVVANGPGDDSATRMLTGTIPPATVPPDEVYRELEDEPRSQLPFILTAFALLATLAILFFVMFNLGNREDEVALVEVRNVEGMEMDEAEALLIADGLLVNVEFENSDDFEQRIAIRTDPPAGEMVEKGSEVDLYISIGSERIPVPAVVGLPEAQARQEIMDAGLTVGEVEERPDPDFAEGVVIETNPAAGVEIGPSIPVNLVVSSGPEVVIVPDVTDITEREAITELTALGLLFTVNEEYNDEVAEGIVIRQDPPADTEGIAGDTVLLVVSLGPEPVQVPDLSNMTESEARQALEARNLVLNVSNSTQPVADESQDGRVVSQVPSVGTTVDQGDTVTVTLGEYEPPPTTTTTTTTPPTTTTTTAPPPDD